MVTAAAGMAFAAGMASARKAGVMFPARVVIGGADVALSVTRFVAVEVVEGLGAALGERAGVSVMGVVAIVNVTVPAVGAVEPGTGSVEDSADKPIGAVVAVGRAGIGSVVEVSVGADGLDTDLNGDLRVGGGGSAGDEDDGQDGEQ